MMGFGIGFGFSNVFGLPAAIGYDRDEDGWCLTFIVGPFYLEFLGLDR